MLVVDKEVTTPPLEMVIMDIVELHLSSVQD
jgi:hypothetical protein